MKILKITSGMFAGTYKWVGTVLTGYVFNAIILRSTKTDEVTMFIEDELNSHNCYEAHILCNVGDAFAKENCTRGDEPIDHTSRGVVLKDIANNMTHCNGVVMKLCDTVR